VLVVVVVVVDGEDVCTLSSHLSPDRLSAWLPMSPAVHAARSTQHARTQQ
jgi:hypothetical protein